MTEQNQFLLINPSVKLTPVITPVIARLDHYFREANLVARVTSGLRDAKDQLRIIQHYLKVKGLSEKYPMAMVCQDPLRQADWQMAWSNLLNIGVIINPPFAATALMDYYRNGKNLKGVTIHQTPHHTGNCFDIGGAGGEDATIADELEVMKTAMADKVPGLINILPEHNNNAIHCDCRKV